MIICYSVYFGIFLHKSSISDNIFFIMLWHFIESVGAGQQCSFYRAPRWHSSLHLYSLLMLNYSHSFKYKMRFAFHAQKYLKCLLLMRMLGEIWKCNAKDYWILLCWSKSRFMQRRNAYKNTLDVGQTMPWRYDDTVIVRIFHNSISTFCRKSEKEGSRIECSSFM